MSPRGKKPSSEQGSQESQKTVHVEPISDADWQERFRKLSPDAGLILSLLAINTSPARRVRLQEACQRLDKPAKSSWNPKRVDAAVNELVRDGWCDFPDNIPVCRPNHREQIVRHLVNSGRYGSLAESAFAAIGGSYFTQDRFHSWRSRRPEKAEDWIRELRHVLITGDAKITAYAARSVRVDMGPGVYDQVFSVLFFEGSVGVDDSGAIAGQGWLDGVGCEPLAVEILVRALASLTAFTDGQWSHLVRLGCRKSSPSQYGVLLLDYALCTGRLADRELENLHGQCATPLLQAHRLFSTGHHAEAEPFYDQSRRACHRGSSPDTTLPFLAGFLAALCGLRAGSVPQVLSMADRGSEEASTSAVELRHRQHHLNLRESWEMIAAVASWMMSAGGGQFPEMRAQSVCHGMRWMTLLLREYGMLWCGRKDEKSDAMFLELLKHTRSTFPWIASEAAELVRLRKIPLGESAKIMDSVHAFRERTGVVPLAGLITPKSEWQRSLEAFSAILDAGKEKVGSEKVQRGSRLTWRVRKNSYGECGIEPYEQLCSAKNGTWSAGRPVSLKRLSEQADSLTFLTEQDRRVCSCIRGFQFDYYGNVAYEFRDDAIVELIGHPLIFRAERPETRIDLIAVSAELTLEKNANSLLVSFSPAMRKDETAGRGEAENLPIIIEETPSRWKVIQLSARERQIRELLGPRGRRFPYEAEKSLKTLLGNLPDGLTLRTDGGVEFDDVPEISAHSKLYLHLSPEGEGLRADFFVRPLGSDGVGHRPGRGSPRIFAEAGGKRVQTVRDLQDEKRNLDEIRGLYTAFRTATCVSDDQFLFETTPDTLSLLAEIQDSLYEQAPNDDTVSPSQPVGKGGKRRVLKGGSESSPQSDDSETASQSDTKYPANLAQRLEVFWPQGEPIRVSRTASFGNMRLAFSSSQDWLAAEGSLQVDDVSLDIMKILSLLDENTESRFIRLSDRNFLALTQEFCRRLGDLRRIADTKGKSLRIHSLSAVGLAELFDAVPSLQHDATWVATRRRLAEMRDDSVPDPRNFRGDLRDYQLDGYRWLARCAKWGVGCCLADDMGLGKTIQALALLLTRASLGPALVVAPTSVCFNWEREAARFAPTLNIRRISAISTNDGTGMTKNERGLLIKSAKKRDVLVVSYALMQQEIELFSQHEYATVILDESQAIKNPESQRAKAAQKLRSGFRMAMTGTPIENNLTELWSLFHFLNPGLLQSQKMFEERFAVPIQRDRSSSARNTLRRLVHPFILRRTKSEVLEELPSRTEMVREVELSGEEAALYESARQKAVAELAAMENPNSGEGPLKILAALTRLRLLCCHPELVLPGCGLAGAKLEAFREIMQELRDGGHRVLVFSQFVKHLELLRRTLDEMGVSYQYLDGSTPEKERQKRVDAFQTGAYDAFLISIRAGGSGLNLTAADYVIHTDPWWNPAVEDQATDRAHRIGQTRPVTVCRLITQGTIEEKIVRLHHEKRDLADCLLDGSDQSTRLTADQLLEILRS